MARGWVHQQRQDQLGPVNTKDARYVVLQKALSKAQNEAWAGPRGGFATPRKAFWGTTLRERGHWGASRLDSLVLAEREGFEPSVRCRTPDFESGTLDHSATSPGVGHSQGEILLQLAALVLAAWGDGLSQRFGGGVKRGWLGRPDRGAGARGGRWSHRLAGGFQARPPRFGPRPGLSHSRCAPTRFCLARS